MKARLHDTELLLGKAKYGNILLCSFFPTTSSADYVFMGHDIICGTSFWSAGIGCPSCVPSQIMMQPLPAHWQDSMRSRKYFDAVLALLNNNLKNPMLRRLFREQIKTQHHRRSYEEN